MYAREWAVHAKQLHVGVSGVMDVACCSEGQRSKPSG